MPHHLTIYFNTRKGIVVVMLSPECSYDYKGNCDENAQIVIYVLSEKKSFYDRSIWHKAWSATLSACNDSFISYYFDFSHSCNVLVPCSSSLLY